MRISSTLLAFVFLLAATSLAKAQVISAPVEKSDKSTGKSFGPGIEVKPLPTDPDTFAEIPQALVANDASPLVPKSTGGFRAISVPEPGALALTGLALAWTIGSLRKARKQRAE
jgi:hypothetical protein